MPDFNTNLRLFQMNSPINVMHETEGYFNAGVNGYTGQFQSLSGNSTARAAVYDKNNLILVQGSKDLNFGSSYFLIGFWVKFANQNFTTDDITLLLKFDDDSVSATTLPTLTWTDSGYYVKKTWAKDSSAFYYRADNVPNFDSDTPPTSLTPSGTISYIDWTVPHYITITRTNDGQITYRCDDSIFGVDTNTANFNLTNNSFLLMDAFGHENTVGNVPIIDDLIIADEDVESVSTKAPTNYLVGYSVEPDEVPWTPTIGNILKVY